MVRHQHGWCRIRQVGEAGHVYRQGGEPNEAARCASHQPSAPSASAHEAGYHPHGHRNQRQVQCQVRSEYHRTATGVVVVRRLRVLRMRCRTGKREGLPCHDRHDVAHQFHARNGVLREADATRFFQAHEELHALEREDPEVALEVTSEGDLNRTGTIVHLGQRRGDDGDNLRLELHLD